MYVWDYPLNEGETLDDFSALWSETLEKRGSGWESFTIIQSKKSIVERYGNRQDQFVIKYHWQETADQCLSLATDRIMVSIQQGIALILSTSVCDFMPPAVIEEISGTEFGVWAPTPVSLPSGAPQP